jgi:hypothetical protein
MDAAIVFMMAVGCAMVDEQTKGLEGLLSDPPFG